MAYKLCNKEPGDSDIINTNYNKHNHKVMNPNLLTPTDMEFIINLITGVSLGLIVFRLIKNKIT